MARKKPPEERENHERWLVSYADFITLLFAFFVVMYSLSAINEGKFRVLAEALAAAFRAVPRSPEPIQLGKPVKPELIENRLLNRSPTVAVPLERPVNVPIKPIVTPHRTAVARVRGADRADMGKAMREIAEQVERAMAPLIEKDLIKLRRYRFWLEIEIKTKILFPSGSATLDEGAAAVLRELAEILSRYPNHIHVEGFTDNVPIHTPLFPSNWELSTARATSVVHLFTREGIDPRRLAVVGYGEFRPLAPNDTEEGRSRNRRVVLVVLAESGAGRKRDVLRANDWGEDLREGKGPERAPEPAPAARDAGAPGAAPRRTQIIPPPIPSIGIPRSGRPNAEPMVSGLGR